MPDEKKTPAPAAPEAPKMELQVAFNNIQAMKREHQGNEDQHSACKVAIETVAYHLNAGAKAATDLVAAMAQIKALTEQNAELTAKLTPVGDTPAAAEGVALNS